MILGKEHYHDHKSAENTADFYDEILSAREKDNKKNIAGWEQNIKNAFQPNFGEINSPIQSDENPEIAWYFQNNKGNRKLKNSDWNNGTSGTYLSYQKIYQNVFLTGQKQAQITFQKEFFLSEMNDLPSKMSYNFPRLNALRSKFIAERQPLFKLNFFRSFPVVIIASGHYPRDYKFDIEDVFQVKYTGTTEIVGNSWYNLHNSDDNKRIVIHTRQLSNGVEDVLLEEIGEEVRKHLNS